MEVDNDSSGFAALLEPATPSRAPGAQLNDSDDPTPLRHFFSDTNNTTGDELGPTNITNDTLNDDDDDNSVETEEREKEIQVVALRILGKPFQQTFWFRDWPIAALIGAVLGIGTLAFLLAVHGTLDLWFPGPDKKFETIHWMRLILTSMGGLVCGLILLIPEAPSLGTVRTMYHDAIDLKVCCFEC